MKKTISAILALLILIGAITAIAAGGDINDPLISRSYLEDTFIPGIMKAVDTSIDNKLAPIYAIINAYAQSTGNQSISGYNYTDVYAPLLFEHGGSLEMREFTSVCLTSGTAVITIDSGEVIDLSSGDIVSSGTLLSTDRRYFATENTKAKIYFYSPGATAMTEGHYFAVNAGQIPPELTFIDVPATHWANSYIGYLAQNGTVNGVGDYRFAPSDTVTRAMFVTILGRLYGADTENYTETVFDDVTAESWYGPYVAWAAENGIVTGYGDGNFGPSDSMTREQMALLIIRYAEFVSILIPEPEAMQHFEDADMISEWAAEAVVRAQKAGIVTGKPDGIFDPRGTATRAEICAVTYRLIHLNPQ